MTKYAKDPLLNEMSRKLKTLTWVNPLDETVVEEVHRSLRSPGTNHRLVSPLPDCRHWNVRIYLGGSLRTIGIVVHQDVPSALRYADMAQEYFWKYRVRGANPPDDRDLNYNRAQLTQDMAQEVHALALLKEIEEYFLTNGILKSSKERHDEEMKKRSLRLNIRTELKLNHGELIESLGGLHETCEGLQRDMKAQGDHLTALEQQNRILIDILKLVAGRLPVVADCRPEVTS